LYFNAQKYQLMTRLKQSLRQAEQAIYTQSEGTEEVKQMMFSNMIWHMTC